MKTKLFALATLAASTGTAFAAGPDLSSLTTAVDISTVAAAILSVAAIMIGVRLVQYAVAKVKAAIR